MPITPYSTPIQFEYKPLGLEGFAKPLSEMQNQYDDTLNKVDALDFDIQALSKDDPAAKEKINSLMEKRNQLRDSLMNTKNFKQGARKILDLNREYTKDEDIQSIQSNAKRWQEYDKAEKARVAKGEITQTEYLDNRAVRMGEYSGYQSGSIDDSMMVENREDDIRKETNSLLNATADQRQYLYSTLGVDPETGAKIEKEVINQYKDKDQIAQEVSKLILTSDKYKEFYNSRADLTWRKYKLAGKEDDLALSTYQSDLENSGRKADDIQAKLDQLNAEKEAGTLPENKLKQVDDAIDYYTDSLESITNRMSNVQNAISTGNVNMSQAKRLFEDQFLEGKVNQLVGANADLYDYGYARQNVDKMKTPSKDRGGASYQQATTSGQFVPDGYNEEINSESMRKSLNSTRKSMDTDFNQVATELEFDEGEMKQLFPTANRIVNTARLENVAHALLSKPKNQEEFTNKLKELNNSWGKLDDKTINRLYTTYSTENGKANLEQHLKKLSPEAARLNTVKNLYDETEKQVKKSTDYKNKLASLSNSKYQLNKPQGTEDQETYNKLYKYADAGSGMRVSGSGSYSNNSSGTLSMTPLQISKALGYTSVENAENAGVFKNDYLKSINKDIDQIITPLIDAKTKNMDFGSKLIISGTDKDAKALSAVVNNTLAEIVQGGAGIQSLKPIMSDQWAGQPGFDEEGVFTGKVISGAGGDPMLGVTPNGVVINIPITYEEDGVEKQTTIHAAFPENQQLLEKEMLLNVIEHSSSNSPIDTRDRNIAYGAIFNTVRTNSTLTSTYADPVEVTVGNPATIYEFNEGGIKMKVVKEGLATKWESGKKNFHYAVKYYDDGKWKYLLNDDNSVMKKADVASIKSEFGKLYADRMINSNSQ